MRKYISEKLLCESEILELSPSHKFYKSVCKNCGKQFETSCSNKTLYCRACNISRKKKELFSDSDYRKKIASKRESTCLSKYGFKSASQDESVKEKMRITCLLKYGTDSYTQTDEYEEKRRETSLRKYGVSHPMKSDIVKNNFKSSMLSIYGVEHALQSEDIVKNIKRKKFYDGFFFDSNDEIEFYKILKNNNIEFETQKEYPKTYTVDGVEHKTIIDFYIPSTNEWIEVKGRQFFDKDLQPVFIYGSKNQEYKEEYENGKKLWEAKFNFLKSENIKIISLMDKNFIEII